MKKRTRKIDVNGGKYIWLCDENLWPVSFLRIWKDGYKKWPFAEMRFDSTEIMTPAIVSGIIKSLIESDTFQGYEAKTIHLMWNSNEKMAENINPIEH